MSHPNLLFLYTDEQAYNTLKTYGNTTISMPNLNRLADESCVFDRAYVSQPVCTPSRSTLLTGLYPHTNGCIKNNIPLKESTMCLPEMIEKADYKTAHFGKWHLGDELFAQHGFSEWISIEDIYNNYFSEGKDRETRSDYCRFLFEKDFNPENGTYFGRFEGARLEEQFSKPAFLAKQATEFIKGNKETPFILYVNFLEPHMPFFGPRDDQYNLSDVPIPENFEQVPTEDQPLKTRLLQQHFYNVGNSGLPLKTEADWRKMISNYWGLCSLIDTHIGKILDSLTENDVYDNTIIVFTSDHGDMMGAHKLIAKCVMFEEAVRVPMMIKQVSQKRTKRINGPVSQINIVPTLLDLMGEDIPDELQGKSLKPYLECHGDANITDDVFIEWNGPDNNDLFKMVENVALPSWMLKQATAEDIVKVNSDPVRTIITSDGWKFNYSPSGENELYNLNEDPVEVQNLVNEENSKPIVKELTEKIVAWKEKTGDDRSF